MAIVMGGAWDGERPGLGPAAPGHRRPLFQAVGPRFPSALEQGPWRHLTLRVTVETGDMGPTAP